ncbi:ABC transporter permease [Microbacterium sp. gxy059]|uniref:ABC transporter permease n=1 Tax=Microbacterium sp. gxy059 TaxID=2957199 RepID=UPI003D965B4A
MALGLDTTQTDRPVRRAVSTRGPRRVPLGWIVPAAIVLFWWGAYEAGWINPVLFSSPVLVVQTLWDAMIHGSFFSDLGVSVGRWLLGFGVGAVLGLLFGAVTGLSRTAERLLDPTFQMLRTIPIMGLVPLFIVWFGLGELPKILLIAIAAFFLVYIEMYAGIRGIDRKLVEVGRMYELSTGQMLRRIIIPGALPHILQGVRLGLGVAWLALVIAELTGANSGIGHWMQVGRENVRVDIVLAALIVFAAVGKIVDSIVRLIERRALGWRDSVEREMSA